MSKTDSPKRNIDSSQRKTNKIDRMQREADRRTAHADYIIYRYTKWPSLRDATPPAPPNEIDDILEGIDR